MYICIELKIIDMKKCECQTEIKNRTISGNLICICSCGNKFIPNSDPIPKNIKYIKFGCLKIKSKKTKKLDLGNIDFTEITMCSKNGGIIKKYIPLKNLKEILCSK